MSSDNIHNDELNEGGAEATAAEVNERASRLETNEEGRDTDAVIAKYERRYHGAPEAEINDFAFDAPPRKRKNEDIAAEKPHRRAPMWAAQPAPRAYSSAYLNEDERLWSSIAHASIWITVLGGMFTGGVVVPFSIFIPLAIFLYWRKRSDYVAFQALQAFAVQVLVTAGVALFAFVGGIVWVLGLLIALLLMIVLVGFILVPVWAIVGVAVAAALAVAPFAALALGTMGAARTYSGRDFQYPGIGRWLDRRLAHSVYQTV
ncbi:MAG TPA: DUF4870 domain-containing protein [Candidatus Limnocylindrales bacterium]|nr:DUF4870 domain-containing protein [Candidatus Limnocylindrales bacterium]